MIDASIIKTFKPRSGVGTACVAFVLICGAGLAPLVDQIAARPHIWLAQYLAAVILAGCGMGLGLTLRKIRAWTAVPLVPGMMRTSLATALALLTLLWLVYIAGMLAWHGLAHLPMTLSLAVGVTVLALCAGIHRRLSIAGLVLFPVVVAVPPLNVAAVYLLHLPATEACLVLLILIFVTDLFIRLPRPIAMSQLVVDERLSFELLESNTVSSQPRIFSWMPVPRTTPTRALTVALNHSPGQAWFNAGISLIPFAALPVAAGVLGGGNAPEVWLVASFLIAIAAFCVPLLRREMLAATIDQLWLAGAGRTRRALLFAAFLNVLAPAFKMCLIGIVFALVIVHEPMMLALSLVLLVLAPAAAALVLASAFLFGDHLARNDQGAAMLFGVSVLIASMASGLFAVWAAGYGPAGGAGLALTVSALVTTGSARLSATWLSNRREWRL